MAVYRATPGVVLLLILISAAAGLTIQEPTGTVTVTDTPADVTIAWTGNSSEYHVTVANGTSVYNITVQEQEAVLELDTGSYELLVSGENESDSTTFSVERNETVNETENETNQETEEITLGLTTNKNTYEVGQNVELTATTSEPVSATLTIKRQGQTEETYTLSIDNTINLIYIPEEKGDYDVTLQAQGKSVQAAFSVDAPEPIEISYTHTQPYVDERTVFTADVEGGEPPYTYQWTFSDDTRSTGEQANHYFFTAGSHSATLTVTDDEGTEKTLTKTFEVLEVAYEVQITVLDEQNDAVENLTVTLTDTSLATLSKETDDTGEVIFEDVAGEYDLRIFNSSNDYVDTQIDATRDLNLLYTINIGAEKNTTVNTTIEANQTINETNTSVNETSESNETVATQSIVQEPEGPTEEELQAQAVEDERQAAIEDVQSRRFDAQLEPAKDRLLRTLKLYAVYDEAREDLRDAKDSQAIENILKDVPERIEIISDESSIDFLTDEDVQAATEAFLEAKKVTDEKLARSYEESIAQAAPGMTIRTEITQARIIYAGSREEYTLVQRRVSSTTPGSYVEIIPKSFAADVSELTIEGDFEVLQSDPVLEFAEGEYTYVGSGLHESAGDVIVIPEELVEVGLLSGLVSFELGETSITRIALYAVILGVLIAGLMYGAKTRRTGRREDHFTEFALVTEQAIDLLAEGNKGAAAQVTPDIIAIYQQLETDKQAALADVIAHLQENLREIETLEAVNDVYAAATEEPGNINRVSAAYERALASFEELPPSLQQNLRENIDQLHNYLDQAV